MDVAPALQVVVTIRQMTTTTFAAGHAGMQTNNRYVFEAFPILNVTLAKLTTDSFAKVYCENTPGQVRAVHKTRNYLYTGVIFFSLPIDHIRSLHSGLLV